MTIRSADFYKIGIVVNSLKDAVDEFGKVYDYEWGDAATTAPPFPVLVGENVITVTNRAVVSRQKPRIHLIEATPGTPWTPSPAGSAHHLAYWVDDLRSAAKEIEGIGYQFECGDAAEDPAARTWGYYTRLDGSRLELMVRTTTQAEWDAMLDSLPLFHTDSVPTN